jgi:hypothetical protein
MFAASGDLKINDRAFVGPEMPKSATPPLIVPGATIIGPVPEVRPAYVVAASPRSTLNLGVDAGGPHALANGKVELRTRASLRSLTWSGGTSAISQQSPRLFDPFATPRIPYPVGTTPYTIAWSQPSTTLGDVTLQPTTPDSGKPIAPGKYNRISIGRGSTLRFAKGTYVIDSLIVESGGTLLTENNMGLVTVVVKNELVVHGKLSKTVPDGNVRLIYKGTNEVAMESNWGINVFAPAAKISMTSGETYYAGALFASAIELHQGSWFQHYPFEPHKTIGRDAAPVLNYLWDDDYPSERSRDIDNDIQGVTHDDNYWYFDNAKDPMSCYIDSGPWYCYAYVPASYLACVAAGEIEFERKDGCLLDGYIWRVPKGGDIADDPTDIIGNPWKNQFDHIGALTYANGHLFVPLENNYNPTIPGLNERGGVGVIRLTGTAPGTWTTTVGLAPYPVVPKNGDPLYDACDQGGTSAWIAYDKSRDLFYSSKSAGSGPGLTCINRYKITYAAGVEIKHVDSFLLRDWNSMQPISFHESITGAEFSPSGLLYLALDATGIATLDVSSGAVTGFTPFDSNGYEYEGLTVWDLDDGSAPDVRGQVHLIVLQNELLSNDDFTLKHFRVKDKSLF